jgi:hypothetical protein
MRRRIRHRDVCFTLLVLCSWAIASVQGGQTTALYGPGPERWVFDGVMRIGAERTLRAAGYDVNSVEDLRRAMKDGDTGVREYAPILLAYKTGREAIPILKQSLDDSSLRIRCKVARVMGILGDLSGLERMRKDLARLTKEQPKKDVPKTEPIALAKDESLYTRSKDGQLSLALKPALVLAEFGDSSGYQIAAEAAVQNKFGAIRADAIAVLAELGRIDQATLQARGLNPEAVLLVVAESETDPFLLECLHGCVRGRMRPVSAIKILEKIEQSPHLSDRGRQIVTSGLQTVRRQLEKEKQAGGRKGE